MPETEDLYEILQVHPSAHPEVVQAAYRRLALLYHPDKDPSPKATDLMAQLNRAYEVLSDPEKRAAYDSSRGAQGNTPSSQPGSGTAEAHPRRRSRQSSLDHIIIGSSKSDVSRIQGPPNSTHLDEDIGEEGWSYDKVYVTFNRAGRVTGWSIFSGDLGDANVRMVPGPNATSSPFFSIDSHKDDVVRLQGTPFRIDIEWGFEFRSERDLIGRHFKVRETWHFFGGTVEFSISTGRVTAWQNKVAASHNSSLKAQIKRPERDPEWAAGDFFTLGSLKRDVQRIQGRPTKTTKSVGTLPEEWHYGNLDKVRFKSGRVVGWSNISRNLKVRLIPGPSVTSSSFFSLGSPKDDVTKLQGTPYSIQVMVRFDDETWLFSGGRVKFSFSSGRVIDWENTDGSLKVRGIRPQTRSHEAGSPTQRAGSPTPSIETQGGGCLIAVLGMAAVVVAAVAVPLIAFFL